MKTEYRTSRNEAVIDGLTVGSPAPETLWTGPDGNQVSLQDFYGAPVVIAFLTGDWDPGRDLQFAIFEQALGSLPESLRLVGLQGSQTEMVGEVEGEGLVRIPLIRCTDLQGPLAEQFRISGENAIFVIDSEGKVCYRHVGSSGTFPGAREMANILNSIPRANLSRRQLVFSAVATLAAMMLLPKLSIAQPPKNLIPDEVPSTTSGAATYTLHINGKSHAVPADPRLTVLDALRDRLEMTGTKKGCDHGQCGACTVHMNGKRVNSCLLLAAQAEGAAITTIEGLAQGSQLHPVQGAFIEHDGFQCGYCTPGQIMSAVACIHEGHTGSDEEIREWMSGNICRCGAYQGILDAVKDAKTKMGGRS